MSKNNNENWVLGLCISSSFIVTIFFGYFLWPKLPIDYLSGLSNIAAQNVINDQVLRQFQWMVAGLTILIAFIPMLYTESKNSNLNIKTVISSVLNIGFIVALWRSASTYPIIAYLEIQHYFPRFLSPFDGFILKDAKNMIVCEYNMLLLFLTITSCWQLMWYWSMRISKHTEK